MTMLTISNSEIQLYKFCRRSWYMQYYLCRQPKVKSATGATNLGTKVHAALEAYYDPTLNCTPAHVLDLLSRMYTLDADGNPDAYDALWSEYDLANTMLNGYFEWLEETGADENLHVESVEREIQVQVTDDITLRGRLDMVVTDKHAGSAMFLDHKTCIQWLTKDYLDRDEQSKFYMMLQRLEKPNTPEYWCNGGIFNMLRKVKRSAKAKPPFYMRETIEHNRHTLNSMYQRTIQTCNEIIDLRAQLDAGGPHQQFAYPHPGKDCVWRCPLASGLCSMMDDGSDWQGYVEDKWELVDPYARYTETGYLERLDQQGWL
jgi:RecB family exonuclease